MCTTMEAAQQRALHVRAASRARELLTSALPLLLVGGLLYAGVFIKPQPKGAAVAKPVFERADRFYGVAGLSSGNAWAVGSNGKIVRTPDGGRSWQLQSVPTTTVLQDIASWDDQRAVAVGNDGVVLATADAGKNWRVVDVPKAKIANKLLRVKVTPGGGALAVGEGGSILRSTDYGATWQQSGQGEDAAWNDIAFQNKMVWLVGEFGRVRRSSDGGQTWSEVPAPVKTSLMSVAFKDPEHGVAVGLNGVILSSGDGGRTWMEHRAPPPDIGPADDASTDRVDAAKRFERGQLEHLFCVIWDGDRWIGVGSKGIVIVGSADARSWKSKRLTPQDRNWYTSIARAADRYYISGSRVATVALEAM